MREIESNSVDAKSELLYRVYLLVLSWPERVEERTTSPNAPLAGDTGEVKEETPQQEEASSEKSYHEESSETI